MLHRKTISFIFHIQIECSVLATKLIIEFGGQDQITPCAAAVFGSPIFNIRLDLQYNAACLITGQCDRTRNTVIMNDSSYWQPLDVVIRKFNLPFIWLNAICKQLGKAFDISFRYGTLTEVKRHFPSSSQQELWILKKILMKYPKSTHWFVSEKKIAFNVRWCTFKLKVHTKRPLKIRWVDFELNFCLHCSWNVLQMF